MKPVAASPQGNKGESRRFREFQEEFAGIDFAKLACAPAERKDSFVAALWRLRNFKGHGFRFENLCRKIIELFRYDDNSRRVIQSWICHAVIKLTESGADLVYGDVLGVAGEISGIFETIFKQRTTLAGIKLGELTELQLIVHDEGGMEVKEFDAVSTEGRRGNERAIVTVFEFKFALSLRKLYEQVIGMDSAKIAHLVVLTKYKQFEQVRNLVYFGEVGDGHITQAIRQFVAKTPLIASRVQVTKKGYSIKFSLSEIEEFLCDDYTIHLAQRAGKSFLPDDPGSGAYKEKIQGMRRIIHEKMEQERSKEHKTFDIIVAVSNAPRYPLAEIKKMIRRIAA
jgi:hypothetical protein